MTSPTPEGQRVADSFAPPWAEQRMKKLEALCHHLRLCRECGDMDVQHCDEGKPMWDELFGNLDGAPDDSPTTSGREGERG